MTEPRNTARDSLRDDILASGHDDFVSMADVQACIFDGLLADLSPAQKQLVVDAVRSLLEDGLMELGDIPGRDDPGFKPWPGTVDEVITRFVDRFVGQHNDPLAWQYSIWLNLTAKGRQASDGIVGKTSDNSATERMIAKYRDLIADFAGGRISTQDFESAYLQVFKTDKDHFAGHEFNVLEALFFAVDDYVADPELRQKVGGLNDEELRSRAEATYSQLYGD
jgi:Bacterial self-protective colicin-like immunity